MATDTTAELLEGDDLTALEHVLHVLDGLLDLPALNRARSLISVLEVSAEVVASALSSY